MAVTEYASSTEHKTGFDVVFLSDGKRLCRNFDSLYLAQCFVRKIKHSKRCKLISYPM